MDSTMTWKKFQWNFPGNLTVRRSRCWMKPVFYKGLFPPDALPLTKGLFELEALPLSSIANYFS